MRALFDVLSPNAVRGVGALAGLAGGLVAGRLADVLPPRYDIALLASGPARTRRNVVLAAACGVIGAGLAHLVTSAPDVAIERAAFYFAINLVLCVAVVAAAAVDLEHMVLPNELTLGGAAIALASSYWRGIGLVGALAGIAIGLGLTYLPFLLYKWIRGRSGMGLGDAKLALLAGAWLGAPGAIWVVAAGALQSAVCAGLMRALGLSFAVPASVQAEIAELRAKAAAGDDEARALLADDPMAADVDSPGADGDTAANGADGSSSDGSRAGSLATMRLPMGPFLVLACLEFVFARGPIMTLFNRYIAPP
jgi:leader peptidase (prepilin peptidase)/N-methyltransferase